MLQREVLESQFTNTILFVIIQRFSARPRGGNSIENGRFAHFLFADMDLSEVLEVTVGGMGYELVDVERSPGGRLLRVVIDKPEKRGGVDVDDCARVSEQLSRVLVVENVDYDRLEVSSPGLDRRLKTERDFVRFAGSPVTLRLRIADNGRRNYDGVLVGLRDGKICLRGSAEEWAFELGNVDRVRLVPQFDLGKSGQRKVEERKSK